MKVDLAKDQKKIRGYILARIKAYDPSRHHGPGEGGAPIKQVTLGYYIEQGGYMALVFDSRPDADSDGEWTGHLDDGETLLYFREWTALFEAWCHEEPAELVLPDGSLRALTQADTQETLVGLFGEMLRDTMIQLRDEGALRALPLAEGAFLSVEEFDGHWAWPPTYKSRKQVWLNLDAPAAPDAGEDDDEDDEGEEERRAALVDRISALPVGEQIAFWISELGLRARGKPSELDKVFLDTDFPSWGNDRALDELEKIGSRAVVPMLELVLTLAQYPEWSADRPEGKIDEMPVQDVAIGAIRKVRDLGSASGQVEQLLHRIVRSACETNAGRTLWGILPYHAARCLHALFRGYPDPAWDEETNRLLEPERFQSAPRPA